MLGTYLEHARKNRAPEWLPHVDVEEFLERLDVLNVKRTTRDEINFSCPFGGHAHADETPSAYMNTGEVTREKATRWTCFGCNRSGNAITFFAEFEGISRQDAARQLKEEYAPGFSEPRGGSMAAEFEDYVSRYIDNDDDEDEETLPAITWEQYHERFGTDWSQAYAIGSTHDARVPRWQKYILGRGFSPAFCEEWGIGYDAFSGRVTIPVADEEGQLVGVKARAVRADERPKYLVLGDRPDRPSKRYGFARYEKSEYLFGLDRVIDSDWVVLVEGELNVMALGLIDIPAVGSGSASVSRAQEILLRDHFDEVVLFKEPDAASRHALHGYAKKDGEWKPGIIERLDPYLDLRLVPFHLSDPADYIRAGRFDALKYLVRRAPRVHALQSSGLHV